MIGDNDEGSIYYKVPDDEESQIPMEVKNLNRLVKDTLEKQLAILSKRSEEANGSFLDQYTLRIMDLAILLDPELRTQSYADALCNLPDGQLTMQDLEEIAAARKERLQRADEEFRRLLGEVQKKESNPHLESTCTLSAQT